jgi:hypothetical protein
MRDFTTVLSDLYDSEINAGVSSFWDDGFIVWLGDGINGLKTERQFRVGDERCPEAFANWAKLWGAAADWLHYEAVRHYPDSVYAKEFST